MADGNTREIAGSIARFMKFVGGSEESIPRAGIADLSRAFSAVAQVLGRDGDDPMTFLTALKDAVRAADGLAGEGGGSEGGGTSSCYAPLDQELESSEQAESSASSESSESSEQAESSESFEQAESSKLAASSELAESSNDAETSGPADCAGGFPPSEVAYRDAIVIRPSATPAQLAVALEPVTSLGKAVDDFRRTYTSPLGSVHGIMLKALTFSAILREAEKTHIVRYLRDRPLKTLRVKPHLIMPVGRAHAGELRAITKHVHSTLQQWTTHLGKDNAHKLLDELSPQIKIDRLKIPGAKQRHSTAAILAKVGNLILEAAVHVKNMTPPSPTLENPNTRIPYLHVESDPKRPRYVL
jgi:hypothetical protein